MYESHQPSCLYGGARKPTVRPERWNAFDEEKPECSVRQKRKAEAQPHGRRFSPVDEEMKWEKTERLYPAFLKAERAPSGERNNDYKRKYVCINRKAKPYKRGAGHKW